MELMYDNERDYWLDVQLNTTECEKCGCELTVANSYPIKVKHKGYPNPNGYIFVCASCKNKSIYDLRKDLL